MKVRPAPSRGPKLISRRVTCLRYSKPNEPSCVGLSAAPVLGPDVDEVLEQVRAAFPLVGVVGGLAPQVVGAGRHLGQLEQAPLLAQVGPAGAAAVGAGDLALGLGVPLHVRANVAEAPLLDLRVAASARLDLVDDDLAGLGVERVERGQFPDGRAGAPQVLLGLRDLLPLLLALLGDDAVDDRLQLHARLGEGIVGQEPFVGEQVERVFLLDLGDEPAQHPRFLTQFVQHLGGVVGLLGGLLDPLAPFPDQPQQACGTPRSAPRSAPGRR